MLYQTLVFTMKAKISFVEHLESYKDIDPLLADADINALPEKRIVLNHLSIIESKVF
jgi:hypothetical protein